MNRRDDLMDKAIWLQNHGYYKGMSIIQLVDLLETQSLRTVKNQNDINRSMEQEKPHATEDSQRS